MKGENNTIFGDLLMVKDTIINIEVKFGFNLNNTCNHWS